MLFVIFCIDKPNMENKRAEVIAAHIEYLNAQTKVKNQMSGPLMDDDMENIVGSLYLLEARNREEIEELMRHDPLVKADIWSSIEIRAFNKRVDNRE